MTKRLNVQVEGIVQGVGFRPYVFTIARQSDLSGWVLNNARGVEIEIEGEDGLVSKFLEKLEQYPPPLCRIHSVQSKEIPVREEKTFYIRESRQPGTRLPLISPDTDVCEDCLKELFDPSDRRYRYPFINCTNCGPRFTIIKDIPYDRDKTTMHVFEMCSVCKSEYDDPLNRRFHAQPIGCWQCGPGLTLLNASGQQVEADDPIRETIKLLQQDKIIAVKGLGGFHLSVDATSEKAVLKLRTKKHREEKPFALMVADIEKARQICFVSSHEEKMLACSSKPIVLLNKKPQNFIAESVAPGNNFFGIMLPSTPVQHLILRDSFDALVMTSGNISEEPIARDNKEALECLGSIADYFLVNNRDIHVRADDSIIRSMAGEMTVLRRSRGHVPVSIPLIEEGCDVLALGGELKNTICFTKGKKAFPSQHIGDMENAETFRIFLESISHLQNILQVCPDVLAYDLHPDYLASGYALDQTGFRLIGVQHHFAHVVSCLAEHGEDGPAIGVAFDGTGYGDDEKIWGGEFFTFDYSKYIRRGYFDYIPMPGADYAVKEPYRMGISYLYRTFRNDIFELDLPILKKHRNSLEIFTKMIDRNINSPLTSSCGRLFDAVAAIIGIREVMTFEGQAPMELEMNINEVVEDEYDYQIFTKQDCAEFQVSFEPLISQIVRDLNNEKTTSEISCRFHNTISRLIVDVCKKIRADNGINLVALSGGVFQNLYLLERAVRLLRQTGFRVLTHKLVPPNDGGISLGQAVIARRAYGKPGAEGQRHKVKSKRMKKERGRGFKDSRAQG